MSYLGRFKERLLSWKLKGSITVKRTLTRLPHSTQLSHKHRPRSGPVLPPELELYIFQICARRSRGAAVRLVLVARRVQIW
jgi:hypothetical protein